LSETLTGTGPVRRRRRWGPFALVVVAALAVVIGRALHQSWSALATAEAAERRGDRAEAVRLYLHAARQYLPGSPFVRRALDRLEAMATAAEKRGEVAAAQRALEAARIGILSARSFYTPHEARLRSIDKRLGALYARIEDPVLQPSATVQAREAWHRARLSGRPRPALGPAVSALAGLALSLVSVIAFVRRGLDREVRLRGYWALAAALGFLTGFVIFLVGLAVFPDRDLNE
jgi:hypothetical protein